MNKRRLEELKEVAENEVRYRGQINGWQTIRTSYFRSIPMTEKEAKIVAHLVHNATVALPEVPISLLLED